MARNKPASAAAAPSSNWIVCQAYTLDVRRSNTDFTFKLVVNGNKYSLDQRASTGLIQRALRVIADRWPAWDWEFQADGSGTITDIR
jgi:hypothetical protein